MSGKGDASRKTSNPKMQASGSAIPMPWNPASISPWPRFGGKVPGPVPGQFRVCFRGRLRHLDMRQGGLAPPGAIA